MSFPDSVTEGVEYATHFKSNPRNIEHPWYGPWNHILVMSRATSSHALWVYPQFPLTQWGVSREESVSLNLDQPPEPFLETDTEPTDDEWDDVFGDEPHAKKKPRPLTLNRDEDPNYKGKAPEQNQSHITTRSKIPLGESMDEYALIQPSTPKRPPGVQEDKAPSSTKTRTLKKNRDSSFTLDFAIIKFHRLELPSYSIFGSDIRVYDAYIPIILECKKLPTRQVPAPGPDYAFQFQLTQQLSDAYEDVHLKAPVAFNCHRLQQSIIGIATCGLWWSFTLVHRGDTRATWSRAFVYGNASHDVVLSTLFEAAANKPEHPALFQNQQIVAHLTEWRRKTYSERDTLATDVN
ncbi:hypothetical protein FRC08_004036 [Ceratobasidium sp. 394]|nr:hypothetical protein FRC08_004036 [Ceratobasidium sp. 394]